MEECVDLGAGWDTIVMISYTSVHGVCANRYERVVTHVRGYVAQDNLLAYVLSMVAELG